MKFAVASVDSLIVYFGDIIDAKIANNVRKALYLLREAKLSYVTDIVPSYTSIMVSYDFLLYSYDDVCTEITKILEKNLDNYEELPSRVMSVPVYYDPSVGLDLESVSLAKKLSIEEVITHHIEKDYFVYAIGFAPGFPYMGEVANSIASPRLANPRAKVPKGSVAIADRQTAIYPKQSPGGWNILGRTPLDMFSRSYDGLSYLRVGDKVNFEPICKEKFLKLGGVL